MNNLKKLLTLCLLVVLIGACGSSKNQSSADSLTNKTWTLEWSNLSPAVPGEQIRITFLNSEGGQSISGFSGCNQFIGSATWDKKKLTVGNMVSTEMYCDGRMDWEKAFHQLLVGADSYQIIEGKLVLLTSKTKIATFSSENKNNEQ